jgi:hypothetical protein
LVRVRVTNALVVQNKEKYDILKCCNSDINWRREVKFNIYHFSDPTINLDEIQDGRVNCCDEVDTEWPIWGKLLKTCTLILMKMIEEK